MRYFICVMLLCGCAGEQFQVETVAPDAFSVTVQSIETKQDESLSLLTQVNSRVGDLLLAADATKEQIETLKASLANPQAQQSGGDPAALEPQETAQANPSHTSQPVALSPAVRLFVTHAPFHCPPCERLKRAVDAGEFAGFAVTYDNGFSGLRSYPAIRFEDATSATGWRVVYGYDSGTVARLRELTGTKGFVSQPLTTNAVVSHGDLVAIHNQLHGGGQWTWPGDLETHLREAHGVQTGGQPVGSIFPVSRQSAVTSSRTSVRSFSRWLGFNRRSRTSSRQSCPSGRCP
jgi:hypothetical protein